MKRTVFFLCALSILALLVGGVALAQSQPGGQMPMGGQPGGMMGGMCPMMGGTGGGMMPMMGGGHDPKAMGRMLQLRADMMRAMADVLAKHGKALEEGK